VNIDDVNQGVTGYKKRKRLGRGIGSGLGKTAGKGHKGQHSRSGTPQKPMFQGGAMPMFRRIPKRGFTNDFALRVGEVNVGELEKRFEVGEEVTPETLRQKDLAKYPYDILKVLGNGSLTKKLKITAHRFSASAREKIAKAGGTIVELPGKKPVVKNKQQPPRKSKKS
jgi:large subunit ribosomal protein L15